MSKTVIHVSDVEAANDFRSVLARVRAGAHVVIEHDATPIAVVRPALPTCRAIADCIALLSSDSNGAVDPDFAADVAAAVKSHPEALTPPAWD
jgi:antitoxin (DNA-binding transcriptional repressor) of toxin-antitoxin stability system